MIGKMGFSFLWGLCIAVIIYLSSSSGTSLSTSLLFQIRHKLGQTPPVSPKVKIIALDDSSMASLKSELSPADLVVLLDSVAKQKPKAILLDRIFSFPADFAGSSLPREAADAPIYSAARFSKYRIPAKEPFNFDDSSYSLDHFAVDELSPIPEDESLLFAYDKSYEGFIRNVGHISLQSGDRFRPWIRHGNYLIPHLAMRAAGPVEIIDGEFRVDQVPLHLSKEGDLLVDFRPQKDLMPHTIPVITALQTAKIGLPLERIQEGDIVIVSFNFYTGSTDFLETPFGILPGSLWVATVADSVASKRWLSLIDFDNWIIVLAGLLAALIAFYSEPGWSIVNLLLSAGIFFFAVCYLFSFHGIVIPWILPLSEMGLSWLLVTQYRFLQLYRYRSFLKSPAAALSETESLLN